MTLLGLMVSYTDSSRTPSTILRTVLMGLGPSSSTLEKGLE